MELLAQIGNAILDNLVVLREAVQAIRDALTGHQLTRTRFISVILNKDALQGVPIGQGKCKGVRIKGNFYRTGTATEQVNPMGSSIAKANPAHPGYFYYGDSKQQTWEYLLFNIAQFTAAEATNNGFTPNPETSKFIPCKDLNDVWLRYPQGFFDNESAPSIEVQVQIYD